MRPLVVVSAFICSACAMSVCSAYAMAGEPRADWATAQIIADVRAGSLHVLEQNEHYAIYDGGVKTYAPTTFLVQSSGKPIRLGAEMRPFMDTAKLWDFVNGAKVPIKADTPVEAYLYNWTHRAQGPMVFDVGVVLEDDTKTVVNDHGFVVKRYPAMKFASLIYVGPFPHQANSGWERIRWEERALENGHVYTQELYRELYHLYDVDSKRHITEVQIEIE